MNLSMLFHLRMMNPYQNIINWSVRMKSLLIPYAGRLLGSICLQLGFIDLLIHVT